MKAKIDLALQALLGLILLVFGLNKFLGFLPAPEMPEAAMNFFGALAASGYMIPFIALTEIVVGILLLVRQWSALALVVLAPLSLNIVLFHLFLAPGGIVVGAVVAILNGYLLFVYKPKFNAVLAAK